jgi:hypothetical protein
MKRLASHKSLIAVGAIAVALSFGAVACGSGTEEEVAQGQALEQRQSAQGDSYGRNPGAPGARPNLMQRRQDAKERLEAQAERRETMLAELREDMSPEDQQLFDELRAAIAGYKESLEQTRQELADTLKQLRELTDEYRDQRDAEE